MGARIRTELGPPGNRQQVLGPDYPPHGDLADQPRQGLTKRRAEAIVPYERVWGDDLPDT
jgi:hypothetical protein